MKKFFLFTAITFLTLSSCKKEATTLAKDETPVRSHTQTLAKNQQQPVLNTASSNRAIPFHINFEESLDGIKLDNLCTYEKMTLYGSAHDVFHGFYDGPNSKITFHYNFPGTVRAVGESGTEYNVTGTLNAQEGEFSPGEFTFKFINKYRFITKGKGNNFFYELTHYLKVDAEGNWTVIRGEVEKTYCQ